MSLRPRRSYWGLRDYGTATWEGGDPACDHIRQRLHEGRETRPQGWDEAGKFRNTSQPRDIGFQSDCGKCGARRIDSQLGLEPTPELYVSRMVEVFREVRRVLTEDGTLWLNLGDSYAAGSMTGRVGSNSSITGGTRNVEATAFPPRTAPDGLKPKDLVGIPWMVAFALRADGWYLRSEIIWQKPNPMPESVTDRPTKAHEQIFLLAKQPRYYFDAQAIAEPTTVLEIRNRGTPDKAALAGITNNGTGLTTLRSPHGERNARSVWSIATTPYPGAHFATFPPELAQRCILAGSAPGDTVLDPFSGSGTTAATAVGHGRNAIGIELNPKYQELARHRIGPMLCDMEAA